MTNAECYIVASVSGIYMIPTSKPYKSKKGIINEYKKQVKETDDTSLQVLQAQWIGADFDEYVQLKTIIERRGSQNDEDFNNENSLEKEGE